MALPDLATYRYVYRPVDYAGIPILTDNPTTAVTVTQAATQQVLGPFDASGLAQAPYQFTQTSPIMFKLFCYNVVTDKTGEFEVNISGQLGSTKCRRLNEDSFAMTWDLDNWYNLVGADASVSITPFSPMTTVSMKCICGIAPDSKDSGAY